jgi:hypothetical protein
MLTTRTSLDRAVALGAAAEPLDLIGTGFGLALLLSERMASGRSFVDAPPVSLLAGVVRCWRLAARDPCL